MKEIKGIFNNNIKDPILTTLLGHINTYLLCALHLSSIEVKIRGDQINLLLQSLN
jgi:hypothetical protein